MIEKIFETPQVVKDLEKWSLVNQYKKAKIQILSGNFSGNRLKFREPKSKKIYYFRINQQFRALARKEENNLIVFAIDNHS